MLYSEIIAVCSQIHTKHMNAFCGYEAEFIIFKSSDMWVRNWVLSGSLEGLTSPVPDVIHR
jgi:hypothetical protein